jgi:hypothetical protein
MIVEDVHKFVVRHPACGVVFPGWQPDQLMWHLAEALRDGELFIAAVDENIYGVIIARIDHEARQIVVSSIITTAKPTFITFVRKWRAMYPDYTVVGKRSGKTRRYNIGNFKRLLHDERTDTVSC